MHCGFDKVHSPDAKKGVAKPSNDSRKRGRLFLDGYKAAGNVPQILLRDKRDTIHHEALEYSSDDNVRS